MIAGPLGFGGLSQGPGRAPEPLLNRFDQLLFVVVAAVLVHLHLHQLGKMPKQHIKGGAAVKGKPKHSLDEGRRDGKNGTRTAATVRRLKMYKSRPVRNSKGHMLSNEYQSKALPSTRIQPDRRWFGKCRIGGDMVKLALSGFRFLHALLNLQYGNLCT